jgi:membrane protease YdiL (CAAX protease family)
VKIRLLLAVCVELIYVTVTRTWLRDHTSAGVERELAVTAFRAASMIVYWMMFRSFILQRTATHVKVLEPWIAIGLTPMLVVPLFFYGGIPSDPGARLVFAVSSIVVAAREEVLYRGVLLNLLMGAVGRSWALTLSSAVFLIYHSGAQPLTPYSILEIFSWGMALGIIYLRQGSLVVPVAIHAVYDASWSLTPLVVLNDWWRIPFFIVGLAMFAVFGMLRSNNRFKPTVHSLSSRPTA